LRASISAAGAGVPRQQPTAETASAIRINHEKSFLISDHVQTAPLLLPFGISSATVESEDNWQRLPGGDMRWSVKEIGAGAVGMGESEIVITWCERILTESLGPRKKERHAP
jgi:hypothetical protein